MDPLKAVLWGLCGASALSGGVSLLFSFRLKHPSLYRTHALMCLSIVVYLVYNIHLYSTASIDEYYTVSRVRTYGTALFHIALLLFAGEYTGVRLRRFIVPVSALFALFLAARHVFPPFLDSTVHGITLHPLPWGGHISMVDLAAGPLFIAYQALVISA